MYKENLLNNEIEIICPKCSKTVTADLEYANCDCGEQLSKKKYIKKPWMVISTTVAFLSGVVGTVGGEYYLVKENSINEKTIQNKVSNRYSTNDEFLILETCIFADDRPLDRSEVDVKKRICICALEKTQHDIDLLIYDKNNPNFMYTFYEKANECMSREAATAAEPAAEAYVK